MDSLSQIVLGAAVTAAAVPRLGRRALVYGAVLGTLPDLDVLLLGALDPLRQFTEHRSFSHSLFVLSALAPLLAWLIARADRHARAVPARRWLLAVWLALVTHPLLDAFTVYGTQLWWPLTPPPTMWASVFIIDPLYTLPLLIACALAWRRRGEPPRLQRALLVGLLLSTGYLGWSLLGKQLAQSRAEALLAAEGRTDARLLVSPAPFTTLLWRAIAVDAEGDGEAWISLRPGAPAPHWQWTRSAPELRAAALATPAGQTLHWFTHGFLRVVQAEHRLRVADLRMGADGDYFFVFDIGQREAAGWQAMPPQQRARPRPRGERLAEIYARL